MLSGTEMVVRVSEEATLGDLAIAVVERHGDCERVHVVLPDHGHVTPWECDVRVADFADV